MEAQDGPWIAIVPPSEPPRPLAARVEWLDKQGVLSGAVESVIALPTGIMVVDAEVPAVLFMDENGSVTGRVGRSGSGPAEFSRTLNSAVVAGAQILIPDPARRIINVVNIESRRWTDGTTFDRDAGMPLAWASIHEGTAVQLSLLPTARQVSLGIWNGDSFVEVRRVPLRDLTGTGTASLPLLARGPRAGSFALTHQQAGTIEVHDRSGDRLEGYRFTTSPDEYTADDIAFLRGLAAPDKSRTHERRLRLLLNEVPAAQRERAVAAAERSGLSDGVGSRAPVFLDAGFDPEGGMMWTTHAMTPDQIRELPDGYEWRDIRRFASLWEIRRIEGDIAVTVAMPPGVIVTDVRRRVLYGVHVSESGARTPIAVRPAQF